MDGYDHILNIENFNLINYQKSLDIQTVYFNRRLNEQIPDTVLLLEHYPVITIGKCSGDNNLLVSEKYLNSKGIDIYETSRGGDITYHGPGQLIGYFIFDLRKHNKDIHMLIRKTEQVIIDTLNSYNIKGDRISGLTGVFVNHHKIAAIGFGVKKWISFHGFAFNINTDITPFSYIIPCGIRDKGVTTMEKLLKQKVELEGVKKEITNNVIINFGFSKTLKGV